MLLPLLLISSASVRSIPFLYLSVLIFPWNVHLQSLIFLKVKSLSCVRLLATPWTVAYQAPPSMESRQEYWSGLPFPSPGDLSTQGLNPGLPHCGQTLHCLSHYVQVIPLTFYLCQNGSNKIHSCVHTIVTNIDITHVHKARRTENKQELRNSHMVDGARFPSFAFSETVQFVKKYMYYL